MLKDAEKAIKVKDSRIEVLEKYIQKLEMICSQNNL
jgi:hypothetical protein